MQDQHLGGHEPRPLRSWHLQRDRLSTRLGEEAPEWMAACHSAKAQQTQHRGITPADAQSVCTFKRPITACAALAPTLCVQSPTAPRLGDCAKPLPAPRQSSPTPPPLCPQPPSLNPLPHTPLPSAPLSEPPTPHPLPQAQVPPSRCMDHINPILNPLHADPCKLRPTAQALPPFGLPPRLCVPNIVQHSGPPVDPLARGTLKLR